MAKCEAYTYGGLGECTALRDPVRAIMLTDKGTTLPLSGIKIIGDKDAGWTSILAPLVAGSTIEKGVLIDLDRGVEVTSAEAEKTTASTGFIEQTGSQQPRMTGYALMSYSEYMGYFKAQGKAFDIPIVLKNGNLLMTPSGANFKGFRGRVFVNEGTIPKVGADLQKECMFDIIFDDPEEWQNMVEVETSFTYTELKDIVPIGLDVEVTTAYDGTGGTATIKVTKRNSSNPFDGVAEPANIQILSSINDVAVAVSTVNQTNKAIGSYVVTSTTSLNGPVWARITAESTTKRTYVSKPFKLV